MCVWVKNNSLQRQSHLHSFIIFNNSYLNSNVHAVGICYFFRECFYNIDIFFFFFHHDSYVEHYIEWNMMIVCDSPLLSELSILCNISRFLFLKLDKPLPITILVKRLSIYIIPLSNTSLHKSFSSTLLFFSLLLNHS